MVMSKENEKGFIVGVLVFFACIGHFAKSIFTAYPRCGIVKKKNRTEVSLSSASGIDLTMNPTEVGTMFVYSVVVVDHFGGEKEFGYKFEEFDRNIIVGKEMHFKTMFGKIVEICTGKDDGTRKCSCGLNEQKT